MLIMNLLEDTLKTLFPAISRSEATLTISEDLAEPNEAGINSTAEITAMSCL